MKISNSKKELAKLISENGGWRKGSHAAQDSVIRFFTGDKPKYNKATKLWDADSSGLRIMGIGVPKLLQNRQRTTLSRAEYFHLYPEADTDGWIEWNGGDCPVGADVFVVCKVRTGKRFRNGRKIKAAILRWHHTGGMADIIAYRPHKPEQAKSAGVGDGETSLAKKEGGDMLASLANLNVAESKPTIEQLASDYRNKLDYAERKQEEADKAREESDMALSELEKAIAAIGFAITPIRGGSLWMPIDERF